MTDGHVSGFREKVVSETKTLFWIFVYLWLLLGLFALHKSLVLNEPHPFWHQGFAAINALVMAKVIFIGQALHVAERLGQKPLIYPITYKSAVYALMLIGFHIVEEAAIGAWHGKTVSELVAELSEGKLQAIFVQGVIMFVVLMPFFALGEISRDLGENELFRQFFVRRTKYVPLPSVHLDGGRLR